VISNLDEQRSSCQAKFVGVLAGLGTLFLPLSFTSALFSMGERYGPGGAEFRIYWAVAVPLLALLCTLVVWYAGIDLLTVLQLRKAPWKVVNPCQMSPD